MDRRDVLRNVSGLGLLAVAGAAPASGRRRRKRRDRSSSEPESYRDRRTNFLGDVEFESRETGNRNHYRGYGGADVTFDADGTEIHVHGWLNAGGCHEIVIDDVTYDPETQTLTVATTANRTGDVCATVITDHLYDATITVGRGSVQTVSVVHYGEEVTSVTRSALGQ